MAAMLLAIEFPLALSGWSDTATVLDIHYISSGAVLTGR
jgi:hypothetical protein